MTLTTTCVCAGLPGKPCKTVLLPEVGYVPPFSQIGVGRLTEQQVLAAVRCDRCARLYPTLAGVRRMYRFPSALAQVRKSTPATSLGELIEMSSLLQESRRVVAASARQGEANRRRERDEQAGRLIAAAQRREAVAA
jgi:hypothetical protein